MMTVNTTSRTDKVRLPDGSLVWLKANSSLTYPERFTGEMRAIAFTGEALFEVAKDARHPFIIYSGGDTTRVLGTSFNLKASTHGVTEMTVLTGTVAITSATYAVTVAAHEKVRYQQDAKMLLKVQPEANEATNVIAGTEYAMAFSNARMDEVFKRIEQKFEVTIEVTNAAVNNCVITADLSDMGLEDTLLLISDVLGIEYGIGKRMITITGEGCQG